MMNSLQTVLPVPAARISSEMGLCAVIAMTGLIEAASGLADLILVGNIANKPDLSPGGLIGLGAMVVHVLMALAALGFAITRRLRFGIAALALWALVGWAGDMSSLIHSALARASGADGDVHFGPFRMFGQPLLGAAALAAAWRQACLGLATTAVAAISIINMAEFALFFIAVSLYGI